MCGAVCRNLSKLLVAIIVFQAVIPSGATSGDETRVGHGEEGLVVTPMNQLITPWGEQLDLPGMRPQAVARSPAGKLIVTAGKTPHLVVVNSETRKVMQRVVLPAEPANAVQENLVSEQILKPDKDGQLSYTGLIFSSDGHRIYMSNVNGSIKVFDVSANGVVSPKVSWSLPLARAPRRDAEIPSGLALSDDGARLYVCGNLSNQLLELDTTTGRVLRTFVVGVAPYDVLLAGERAYVSNWGGRRPRPDDLTGPAGRGTRVLVDPVMHIAKEGSVSVIDLESGEIVSELLTGMHASGLAKSPDEKYVICCNATSDYLSVIDTEQVKVIARIWTKPNAADLLGAAPNAACFNSQGNRIFVANGSQNAIAVVEFSIDDPNESQLLGLIPVGWYPGALLLDPVREELVVANIKGVPKEPEIYDPTSSLGFNSHQHFGSLTFAPLVEGEKLAELSEQVARNMRRPRIAEALLPPRENQPPRVIPQRIGEPSLIKHVVYIIKENRTFDQVLGDSQRGDSDHSLCIFGKEITPNHHKLAEQFVLLDNTYCCGILSADGHQWSNTAYSTDYLEKSFAGFPRSYPDGMGVDEDDALSYPPSGFIWDNAVKHGVSVRNYGEFMGPLVTWRDKARPGQPDFTACYRTWKGQSTEVLFSSWPSVESLRPFSPTDYVGWEMSVPDQYRADFILRELAQFEKKGEYPRLTIICLPNDHTSGTSPNCPTPSACMADNDLAFGRIIEGLSNSKFWPEMAIFAIEDDPQAGWDHVSGYRTIAFCVSPYAKRGALVSEQYNTTSVLRTIEQILGLPPMNQFDASATPMTACFTEEANWTPYDAEEVSVPLDQMNPQVAEIGDPILRKDAVVSASLNFREVDRAPEDVLNRILWRAMRGSDDPYPEWAVSRYVEDDD